MKNRTDEGLTLCLSDLARQEVLATLQASVDKMAQRLEGLPAGSSVGGSGATIGSGAGSLLPADYGGSPVGTGAVVPPGLAALLPSSDSAGWSLSYPPISPLVRYGG
jgi:hypothetical protein